MYLLIFSKADYEAFQNGRLVNPDASRSANGTAPISSYFRSSNKYKHSDPEQKAISKAILNGGGMFSAYSSGGERSTPTPDADRKQQIYQ